MSNFFQQAQTNVKGLEEELLGPDYQYFKFIKPPEEMGMGAEGDLGTLANDIGGLIGYVQLLVEGGGKAQRTSGPLGNKFFLATGAKCTDLATGNKVTRSVYINNVPDGSIPFISSALNGQKISEFRGLVPGTMSNLAHINPMQMFQAFMTGTNPDCQKITLETIDVNNIKGKDSAYMTVDDISSMDKDWFAPYSNKDDIIKVISAAKNKNITTTTTTNVEKFTTLSEDTFDYSKMPNDMMVKVYYSALGLLGLYIFLRMFQKKDV